jgi:hypothetical protein
LDDEGIGGVVLHSVPFPCRSSVSTAKKAV